MYNIHIGKYLKESQKMKIIYDGRYNSPREEMAYLLDRLNNSNGILTKDDCDRIETLSKIMNKLDPNFPIIEFKEEQ